MSLTIELHRIGPNKAQAQVDGEVLADFDPQALLAGAPRRGASRKEMVAYGRRLWAALGGEALGELVDELAVAPDLEGMIVLCTSDAELAGIAWEGLYHPEEEEFLILDYLVVREVPTKQVPAPPDVSKPWRLVVLSSQPLLAPVRDAEGYVCQWVPMGRLQVVRELESLRRSLEAHQPPVPLRWQQIAPTRAALSDLAGAEPMWFHYTGHGDVENGTPVLCFDDGTGRLDAQPVKKLARRLRGRVYLAFLNACRTADGREPNANLALGLVRGGVPVVLGTRDTVLDEAAALFAWTFYQQLAVGEHPAVALYRARLKLTDCFRREPYKWTIPVLYMAQGYLWPAQEGEVTETLTPILPPPSHTLALQAPNQLFGREQELVDIATAFVLDNKKIVTIRGAGGIGKTALAHALAQRLRFHFQDGIYALTLLLAADSPLQAALVRRQLAALLGLGEHAAFEDPTAFEKQEVALLQAAQARPRSLIIFDNYETVLACLRATSAEEKQSPAYQEADAIQRLVTRLAQAQCHLLFTSRQTPVGLAGEYLYPEAWRGQELAGLTPRPSLALFKAHAGTRSHTQELATQVSQAVGYNPLFIELAASRWRTSKQTEKEFIAGIHEATLKAEQDGVPHNRRSAIVNVRLSVDALSPERRHDFLTLSIIANPIIRPIHGAVIWGLEDEKQWFSEQAHEQLEFLRERSLLRGVGYDEKRHRTDAYTLQPVIAEVIRTLITNDKLADARTRYARWAAHVVNRAYGKGGIDFSARVANYTQAMLNDLPVALSYLPIEERGWPKWLAGRLFRLFGQPERTQEMLDSAERIAQQHDDQALLSGVYYERAQILETRGDLAGAMSLYQQSLDIDDALGDVRGKGATLVMLAQIQFREGKRELALHNTRESLRLFEHLGATREMAQVRQILAQMEGASSPTSDSAELTPARLAGRLVAATTTALEGVKKFLTRFC